MKAFGICLLLVLIGSLSSFGSLYTYAEEKRPAVSLREASAISEAILAKLGKGNDYYAISVSILGDKEQSGAGAWTLEFRNVFGHKVYVSIHFPEDVCVFQDEKDPKEKLFKRDGSAIPEAPVTEPDPFAPKK